MESYQQSIIDKISKLTEDLHIEPDPEINEELGLYECNACMRVRGDIIKCETCTYHSCTECREQFEEKQRICAGCRTSIDKPKIKPKPVNKYITNIIKIQQHQSQQTQPVNYLVIETLPDGRIKNPITKRWVAPDKKIGLDIMKKHLLAIKQQQQQQNQQQQQQQQNQPQPNNEVMA